MLALARRRQRLLPKLAALAATLASHRAWFAFGYRSQDDFMRERLNRPGRWFRHLLQLQRAFDALPALADAVRGSDGGTPVGQMAALEIAKVATPETLFRWITTARRLTLAQLRAVVASHWEEDQPTGACRSAPTGTRADPLSQERVSIRLQLPPDVLLTEDLVIDLFHAVNGRETGLAGFITALLGESMSAGWVPEKMADPSEEPRHPSRSTRSARDSPAERESPEDKHPGSGTPTAVIPRWHAVPGSACELSIPVSSYERTDPASARELSTIAMHQARSTLATFDRLLQEQADLMNKLRIIETAPNASPPTPQPHGVDAPSGKHRLLFSNERAGMLRSLLQTFRHLARIEDILEHDMAALILDLHEERAWPVLGESGLESFGESLGFGRSTVRSRVSLVRSMRSFPEVQVAFRRGHIGREAAQWLVRVFQRDRTDTSSRAAWIEHARTTTVRRLRDEERLLRRQHLRARMDRAQSMTRGPRGEPPGASAATARRSPSSLGPNCLGRLEAGIADRPGNAPIPSETLDDATWRASLERAPGRTRNEVIALGHALVERLARGGPLLLHARAVSVPRDIAMDLHGCLRAVRRDLVARMALEMTPAEEARLRPSARMARELLQRGLPLPDWLAYLALLEEAAWVWDHLEPVHGDGVFQRDGYRCMAPGCTARAQLQLHHLKYRSWGGGNEPDNLLSLCLFHHQQGEHGTLARCRGRAPLDVVWRLGSKEIGTWFRNERLLHADP